MSDYLAYLQHYWKDVRKPSRVRHEWGTKTRYFHERIEPGDTIWVVITGGPDHPQEWRLIQQIYVGRLYVLNDDAHAYRAQGDRDKSHVYEPEGQPNLETVLRQLEFLSGKQITLTGRVIGQALQTIRPLTERDGWLLRQHSAHLTPI